MSVWLDHVKATRKKCPGMSFKEVLIEAKKTYNKSTKIAVPVECKTSKKSRKSKNLSKKTKSKRRRRKTRKTVKGKKRKSVKGKRKTHKVPKKFKCKLYPNAPNC